MIFEFRQKSLENCIANCRCTFEDYFSRRRVDILTIREALIDPFQKPFENRSLRGSPYTVLDESLSGEGGWERKKIEEEGKKKGCLQQQKEALKLLDLHSRKPRRRDKAIGTRSPRTVYQRRDGLKLLGWFAISPSQERLLAGGRFQLVRNESCERINDTCIVNVISTNGAINRTIFYL